MSRLALFVAVPALAAAIGLAVVSLDLASQVESLEARMHDLESDRPTTTAATNDATASPRPGMSRAELSRVRALEERLEQIETRVTAAPSGGTPAALSEAESAEYAAAAGDPGIRRAVEDVLEARDAARRAERLTRAADARTRQLLRGLEVTETQTGDVLRVVTDGLRRRDEMRDQELERELQKERSAELLGELERALESILNADQMEQVRPRLDLRRGQDGRRRGGGERRRGRRAADGA